MRPCHRNGLDEGELLEEATVKENLTVQTEGQRRVSRIILIYSLPMILADRRRGERHGDGKRAGRCGVTLGGGCGCAGNRRPLAGREGGASVGRLAHAESTRSRPKPVHLTLPSPLVGKGQAVIVSLVLDQLDPRPLDPLADPRAALPAPEARRRAANRSVAPTGQ